MASICKEFTIAAGADTVWQALRAVGEVHRFAPGFVADCRMDGEARVVTFANGLVTRELIVDVDDAARRLAYSARSERLQHHNASFQVFEAGASARVVWIADLLPNAAAAAVSAMMDQGAAAMSNTLGGHSQAA
jgi:carbon monoxide dehydrogenase subunit G